MSNTSLSGRVKDDTTIGIAKYQLIEQQLETEYFVVLRKDTSIFSLHMTLDSVDSVISCRIEARSGINSTKDIQNDTDVLAHAAEETKNEYGRKSYIEQLRELQLTFCSAAKDFDLKRLTSINFSMTVITGLSEDIKGKYEKLYGEEIAVNSNNKIADLIKKSQYVKDFNSILANYGIKITDVFVDELISYYVQSSDTQESKNSEAETSKPVIGGLVIFNIGVQ
jgi:hypothetical protein